ncbi:MAG: SCO family protein [Acidobacteria bacterium]|nr:SCO family protein [Acidobacteriota bacterium]MBV9475605.1 SCO family protein [Acidobacteriota bacterium]
MILRRACAALLLVAAVAASAQTSSTPARLPGNVSIAQKLGSRIPLQLMFRDETGGVVHLDSYFHHDKPVLLQFVYYSCPMLCPMVLEGTTSALTELKFDINKQFDVITVSMDPRDKPAAAMQFKEKYLRRYGRLESAPGWHFLTGNESSIKALADSVGFQFAYDGQRDQFAHGAALMVLTPEGVTSRYFYGFEYKPRDLRLAITEASAGKVGGFTEQLLLLCYHYDPAVGKYSRDAMTFARAGGVATVAFLGGFIFLMLRSERRKSSFETTP